MNSARPKELPRCLQPDLQDWRWSPPLSIADLATRLETEGVTSAVARNEYGFDDSWAMAASWFPQISILRAEPRPRKSARQRWSDYLQGISFALPLILCCVTMFVLGFSLWGGDLEAGPATAIGCGTIASFIGTGGFIQAMSRRGIFYRGTEQPLKCWHSTWFWVRLCVLTNTAVAGVVLLANAYFRWVPFPFAALAVSFYICLGVFWVATGMLYMLERHLVISLSCLTGIGTVIGLHLAGGIRLLAAQLIGILVAAAGSFCCAAFVLKPKVPHGNKSKDARRLDHRGYLLWPYIVYGALYYLFVFGDRVLAWTAQTGMAYATIVFRGDYELACVIGLGSFVLQVGWVHVSTRKFYATVVEHQARCYVDEAANFNSGMLRFYVKQTAVFLPCAIVVGVPIFAAADSVGVLGSSLVREVAIWSLAGYPFLVFALWNVSLLFALSRSVHAVRSIAIACCVNFAVGYVASRLGGYHLAIVGFVVGSLVFAILTSFYSVVTFRRLDYHYLVSAV